MSEYKYNIKPFDIVRNEYYSFFELSINGRFYFSEFVDSLDDKSMDKKNLNGILAYMNVLGPHNLLPKEKFRPIKDSECSNLYEFKKKDIRVYIMLIKPNVYIVLGGYKGNQKLDIKKVINWVKDFNIRKE